MKRLLFVVIAIVALNYGCKEEKQPISSNTIELISPQEMQEISQMEDVQLIDVRTPKEYKEGYIEGFQNIDFFSDTFSQEIEKLDKSKPVIVYCRSGRRSSDCAKQLKEEGFVKIYDLEGGITKWEFEGYEIRVN
ncbi:rhodanese-like domain-containing protein [Pontimicrobium aquaticum]|uniref:Rhodanese-like domain-containing protein n=1 Tax=Pontimicrobium aquaticum TaxID=2565367 RepID=A0A4V5LR23_9FLAO|nr:rhodanese-like domain-containing protein [Pontimicrobium aquaticum]TJY37379.1 rhodanese-like domain-containing protein [Pontimicrobium aquaticum]